MRQQWRDLLFAHWEVPVESIAKRLPPGLGPDLFEGRAYLGLVPFSMAAVRPVGLPPAPWLSWFLELNLRTYVVDREGNPGVWFFSLEANRRPAVWLARSLFHLPYHHAAMRKSSSGSTVDYHCHRLGAPPGRGRTLWSAGPSLPPAEPGSLAFFLVERYLLHVWDDRRQTVRRARVWHRPYPLRSATLHEAGTAVFTWNGFAEPAGPPAHLAASQGVDVWIHPLEPV